MCVFCRVRTCVCVWGKKGTTVARLKKKTIVSSPFFWSVPVCGKGEKRERRGLAKFMWTQNKRHTPVPKMISISFFFFIFHFMRISFYENLPYFHYNITFNPKLQLIHYVHVFTLLLMCMIILDVLLFHIGAYFQKISYQWRKNNTDKTLPTCSSQALTCNEPHEQSFHVNIYFDLNIWILTDKILAYRYVFWKERLYFSYVGDFSEIISCAFQRFSAT